jgi:hypothetical protein
MKKRRLSQMSVPAAESQDQVEGEGSEENVADGGASVPAETVSDMLNKVEEADSIDDLDGSDESAEGQSEVNQIYWNPTHVEDKISSEDIDFDEEEMHR